MDGVAPGGHSLVGHRPARHSRPWRRRSPPQPALSCW